MRIAFGVLLILASLSLEAKLNSKVKYTTTGYIGGGNFNLVRSLEKNQLVETSGLLISTSGHKLYESGYINGQSYLIKLEYPSLEPITSIPLENSLNGTGIGQCHYHLFQFTQNSRSVLEYKYPNDIKFIKLLSLPSEMRNGYGLTKFDHRTLVASDGTNRIFFLDCYQPLKINNILNVFNSGSILNDINALAVANNFIYATVYRRNLIYKINSSTGQVVQTFNLEGLAENEYNQQSNINYNSNNNSNNNYNSNSNYDLWEGWVPRDSNYDYNIYNGRYLNSIAYDTVNNNFIVTGKNWRYFYIITLN